ncbi:AraC family transcriptional regulator [Aliarcobacter butzleri]|uniref:helix-turn-helix domain-containing protein n=1 Tax=Aliarcobacter butzleri TaxID=28197 RepID=UPI00063AA7C1|nr:AraC family transcriptional regulator [Aliarcobacter butzleri]KLE07695.1 AraC family transcriptional regulator [Aliarcobacter butzleri L354]MCG3652943.1 AraC family transcriptional regulator [Aliarcobacter butzleri]MCG3693974.1 AraC family transcriptional regulator [Aliarcobacter butzleri]MDN5072228.1 AraC family transcriptional regulator [Aliarcobacter butzleri]MDN5077132.1 AraC family transcriptional regulator [Aliarcobacter butzleri]
MSHNFTIDDISEFMSFSQNNKEFNLTLPDNFGFMNCTKDIINNDICLYKTHAQANNNLSIKSDAKVDCLFINIILEGKVQYQSNPYDKIETFKKNDTYIKYIEEYNATTILDKNNFSKGLAISIKNSFLEKNLSTHFYLLQEFRSENKNISTVIHKKDTQTNIKLANELFNSPFKGELHDIYLQSKVLEIIYNELNEILNNKKSILIEEKIKLSNEDIQALYKARDIILLTHDFPDLSTLARKVAINEFKLKFGFKKLFNTTVGQMILEHKMIHAKQLLETSEFSILEIANFVGYKYQQSFSNAFFQFFGLRPKDVMKSRNYYY